MMNQLKDDEPIIVQDDSDEEVHAEKLKEEKTKDEDEAAILSAQSFYLNVTQLTELLVKSLQPELSKLLSSHDFSSSLPTKLKELLSKLNELTREVKELKKHVHDLEIELLEDLKEIPNKLQTFTSTVKSLTTQVAELKTLYLLNKITKALNKFGHVIESASKKTRDTSVPSAGQAGSHPAEGEKNTQHLPKKFSQHEGELIKKDKGKESMSSKDAEEEKLKGDHVHFTKEQIKEQNRIEESVKADLAKQELKGVGWPTIYEQIHTRIDYLHKTKVELGIDLDKPLGEHDPLDKLNDLARKKRKHPDDIHDLFRRNLLQTSSRCSRPSPSPSHGFPPVPRTPTTPFPGSAYSSPRNPLPSWSPWLTHWPFLPCTSSSWRSNLSVLPIPTNPPSSK
ncbi:hypothetical protein Tco_1098251 [Tanacetum coccineum]